MLELSADILASIMRQAIGSLSKPLLSATHLLKQHSVATAAFIKAQAEASVPLVDAQNEARSTFDYRRDSRQEATGEIMHSAIAL